MGRSGGECDFVGGWLDGICARKKEGRFAVTRLWKKGGGDRKTRLQGGKGGDSCTLAGVLIGVSPVGGGSSTE